MRTTYNRYLIKPTQRKLLRREELVLEVTEAITAAMRCTGTSKDELAKLMGHSRVYVTDILEGKLTLDTLAAVADALDCKVSVRLLTR